MKSKKVIEWAISRFEIAEDFGIIWLDNGNRNEISTPVFLELDELDECIKTRGLKGLIISGVGKHFSTGADVNMIRKEVDSMASFLEQLQAGKAILDYIEDLKIPTIAAVNGCCFGAGLEIALSCHYRIGTSKTIVSFPESTLGFLPGMGGTYRLPRLIGQRKAMEIILTGETVNSEDSHSLGIIDQIVKKSELLEKSLEFLEKLTKDKSLLQIGSIITSINNVEKMSREECTHTEGKLFGDLVELSMRE